MNPDNVVLIVGLLLVCAAILAWTIKWVASQLTFAEPVEFGDLIFFWLNVCAAFASAVVVLDLLGVLFKLITGE